MLQYRFGSTSLVNKGFTKETIFPYSTIIFRERCFQSSSKVLEHADGDGGPIEVILTLRNDDSSSDSKIDNGKHSSNSYTG